MDINNFHQCYYAQHVCDLPITSCTQCKYYSECERQYREIYETDPCGGRDCITCEIGGCDHGTEVT